MKLKLQKGQGLINVILILAIIIFAGGILYFSFFSSTSEKPKTIETSGLPKSQELPNISEKSTSTKEETKSEAIKPKTEITSPSTSTPTPPPSQETTKKLTTSGIYTIEDDGTLITLVPSDRGIVTYIDETGVINKFFREYPAAPNVYDFATIFVGFKPANGGHFTHARDLDSGISDYQAAYDLNQVRQSIGYNGQGKFKGFAFIPDMYNTIDNSFWIVLHEISHRWLFFFKNAGMTDASFAHYKDSVNTLTRESDIVYKDPNGGGSLTPNPSTPGYCLDFGSPDKYRFTNLSLYLMGLIPPEPTTPLKYYETSGSWSDKGIPCVEKTFSVQDVMNIAGPRQPSYSSSPKNFSVAYILLTHKGEKPTDGDIQKMNSIADNFPVKWNEATNYKSTINGKGTIR